MDGLIVASDDLRGRPDRPDGFGVDAMPGAFTLWNRQLDPSVRITATLQGHISLIRGWQVELSAAAVRPLPR